jgi:Flp pilus assembly protein TadG
MTREFANSRPEPGVGSRFASFLRSRSGLAAVEFAFIAPIMILLFFGTIEGSAAYSTNRRIVLASSTLADLVAQETSITKANLEDLFTGMEDVVGTNDGGGLVFRVVSVVLDPDTDQLKVHWSLDSTGATPYAAGSVYAGDVDAALFDDASSLIVAETSYDYSSPISKKVIGDITMKRTATRWPRMSAKVQYCVVSGSCTS